MTNGMTIMTEIKKKTAIITITFSPETLYRIDPDAWAQKVIKRYRDIDGESSSCMLAIDAKVAGEKFIKVIRKLYDVVVEEKGGKLVCVGYPADLIDGLETSGMNSLPGFFTCDTLEEAMKML